MINAALLLRIYELVEDGSIRTMPHDGSFPAIEGNIQCDDLLGYQVAIINDNDEIVWACIEEEFHDESEPVAGYDYTGHSIEH